MHPISDNQPYHRKDLVFNKLLKLTQYDQGSAYKLDTIQLDAITKLTDCKGKIRRLLPVLATSFQKATNKEVITENAQLPLKKASIEAVILVLANKNQTSALTEILS